MLAVVARDRFPLNLQLGWIRWEWRNYGSWRGIVDDIKTCFSIGVDVEASF
jgi:DUF2075 family protein